MTTPSLSDDEATLASYAGVLADAIAKAIPAWFDRCVGRHLPLASWQQSIAGASYQGDAAQASAETVAAVRALLETDITNQAVGPLEILRRAVSFPTSVLRGAGVEPVRRDDFAQRSFPDDVYDLTPASFVDVDASLHEPGLVWGAAKAHVHLRRRREHDTNQQGASAIETTVVVLCTDLMDRSKISGAFPEARFVRNASDLASAAAPTSLVLVDLRRVDDPSELTSVPGRIVAFGSHVNEAVLAAAEQAGAQSIPRSVFFKRLASGSLNQD